MKITLHSDNQTSATSVPNTFIDEYMSAAPGEFVKIYLYLLRLMNVPDATFSISSIADKFEHTEKDIRRALGYWERMQLIRLEYDGAQNLTGVCLLDSASKRITDPEADKRPMSPANTAELASPAAEEPPVIDVAAPAIPEMRQYSADDIYRFQQDEAIAELFFITERYLGRPLTSTDINIILYIYDGLGFSTDLIEYLVEYCVCKGHTSIRYIEKVALAWTESHISTVADAKRASSLYSQSYYIVMKEFGISGRNLVPAETGFIEKWQAEYGFTTELIGEACRRTMQTIHQPSFEYADSILSGWHKNQVHSPKDIAKLDAEHQRRKKGVGNASAGSNASAGNNTSRNKFDNFSQRTYDYDELEKLLLTTSVQ